MTRSDAVRIGCSGWNYKSWRTTFYPTRLPIKEWLRFYTSHFDTVEVNNTFYRLPERSTFESWREQVPEGFLFAVKASRFLTHMKRLRDPEEPLDRLLSRASALGPALGPVLYQLPARFTRDLFRLDDFLNALPQRIGKAAMSHVMEFRDPSWYVSDTFDLLQKRGVALCLHDKDGSKIDGPFVGPFVYVRFHGTSGHYHGSYPSAQLTRWAVRLAEQAADGKRVFAYFNNDPDAIAVANARTLRSALAKLV
jgi:uncharacterized protein YecE (DUF72 family)